MLIPKFDLYKSGWLELVFDDRNKDYGAYDLRKHYAGILSRAMGIAFLSVVLLFGGYDFYLKSRHTETYRYIPDIPIILKATDIKHPVTPPPPVERPPVHANSVRYPTPVVRPDVEAQNPPTIDDEKKSAISTVNSKGDSAAYINIPDNSGGNMNKVTEDETVHSIATVEVMPQFPGGEAAWGKFLQKNLHYPGPAVEAGVSGKVFVSFVIEKDGHITDIKVERSPGYGLDEEAVRVLKLAPAWKPGIQNGQPVRVRYIMPFNFQIPSDNN